MHFCLVQVFFEVWRTENPMLIFNNAYAGFCCMAVFFFCVCVMQILVVDFNLGIVSKYVSKM